MLKEVRETVHGGGSNPALALSPDLKMSVMEFYARYAESICDDKLEDWPGFFVEDCVYKVIPRVNLDRNLPVSLILAESRGGLIDRMTAIRNTMVFGPRYISHSVSGIRVLDEQDGILRTRSMFSIHQTLVDRLTELLIVGRSFDRIDTRGAELKFVERIAVLDSESLPSTIVYPV